MLGEPTWSDPLHIPLLTPKRQRLLMTCTMPKRVFSLAQQLNSSSAFLALSLVRRKCSHNCEEKGEQRACTEAQYSSIRARHLIMHLNLHTEALHVEKERKLDLMEKSFEWFDVQDRRQEKVAGMRW